MHVFWLSGFIFFGSSNGLFERIKQAIEAQQDKPVGYVVLDFSAVPGLDTSAVLSLVKLRNYCEENDVTLAFSDLSESMRVSFERAAFFGPTRPHQVFGSRNEAIEWCEDMLLMHHEVGAASIHSFESWLQAELGVKVDFARIASDQHHLRAWPPDPLAAHAWAHDRRRDGLLSRRAARGERDRRRTHGRLPAHARGLRQDAGRGPHRRGRIPQAHHQTVVGPSRIRQSRDCCAALISQRTKRHTDTKSSNQPVRVNRLALLPGICYRLPRRKPLLGLCLWR